MRAFTCAGVPVVRQTVVVECFAQGVAPVSVIRSYGGGQGIRFGLTDKSCSVGVHDVLQNTGAGIVARDEEHFVGRYLRGVYFRTFFAHCFVGGFGFFVGFYFFGPFGAELVMDRIHKQPYG